MSTRQDIVTEEDRSQLQAYTQLRCRLACHSERQSSFSNTSRVPDHVNSLPKSNSDLRKRPLLTADTIDKESSEDAGDDDIYGAGAFVGRNGRFTTDFPSDKYTKTHVVTTAHKPITASKFKSHSRWL